MGRANRLLAPGVTAIACAFPTLMKAEARVRARAVVVGNPVRPAIRALADLAYDPPGADAPLHLFITGGSQGARVLSPNRAGRRRGPAGGSARPPARRPADPARGAEAAAAEAYREAGVEAELAAFFADMAQRWTWAHLVIARSGASTGGRGSPSPAGRRSWSRSASPSTTTSFENARLLSEAAEAAVVFREADPDRPGSSPPSWAMAGSSSIGPGPPGRPWPPRPGLPPRPTPPSASSPTCTSSAPRPDFTT